MDPEIIASPDEPLKAVLARRQALVEAQHPDTRMVDSVVLKDGPRAHKVATRWIIVDRHTGKPHHNVIRISTFTKRKAGWSVEDEHSITLDDKEHDEIGALATFIGAIKNTDIPDAPGPDIGASVGANQHSPDSIRALLGIVSADDKAGIIVGAKRARGSASKCRSSRGVASCKFLRSLETTSATD
jgi:hypothetical protein